jgi:putative restriction endonuclease
MITSEQLKYGNLYTREDLSRMFGITDATIKTGIFRPKGHDSIWLFVTKEKTPDRTQYNDDLRGDDLFMEGQTRGRKDRLLIEHEDRGLELVLFYRKTRFEHPGAAFRYEGRFKYIDHTGSNPARFHLKRER